MIKFVAREHPGPESFELGNRNPTACGARGATLFVPPGDRAVSSVNPHALERRSAAAFAENRCRSRDAIQCYINTPTVIVSVSSKSTGTPQRFVQKVLLVCCIKWYTVTTNYVVRRKVTPGWRQRSDQKSLAISTTLGEKRQNSSTKPSDCFPVNKVFFFVILRRFL